MPKTLPEFIADLQKSDFIPRVISQAHANEMLRANSLNAMYGGMTALEIVANAEEYSLLRLLIEQGATEISNASLLLLIAREEDEEFENIISKNIIKNYQNMLRVAGNRGNVKIFDFLIKAGAPLSDLIEETNEKPLEKMLVEGRTECVISFISNLTDDQLNVKNAEGGTYLHTLFFHCKNKKKLEQILAILLNDIRIQPLIIIKDFYGRTILDLALTEKTDDIIKLLIKNPNIDVTNLLGYGQLSPNYQQTYLDQQLINFLAMRHSPDVCKPQPYIPSEIIHNNGNCNGWGWWFAQAGVKGLEALNEFYAMQKVLSNWNGKEEFYDAKPGLITLLKELNLPISLLNKFPPIKTIGMDGKPKIREATVADLFYAMCNTLALFQSSARAITDLHLTSLHDRGAQNILIGDTALHNDFYYPTTLLNAKGMNNIITFCAQFKNRIFDITIYNAEQKIGHRLTFYSDTHGALYYYDPNLRYRLATSFTDYAALVKLIMKMCVPPFFFIGHEVYFKVTAYHLYPASAKPMPINYCPAFQHNMGFTEIHWTILTHDYDNLQILIQKPDIAANLLNEDYLGSTPMMLAIKQNDPKQMEMLLRTEPGNSKKPYPHSNLINLYGLHFKDIHNSFLHVTIKDGLIADDFTDINGTKLIQVIKEHFPPASWIEHLKAGWYSAFLYYLQKNRYIVDYQKAKLEPKNERAIVLLAINDLLDVNFADHHGTTILILAAKNDMVDEIEMLVRKMPKKDELPIDVNKADENKMTPLMWAVKSNKPNAARALVNAGADPTLKNSKGLTAADFITENSIRFVDILDPLNYKFKAILHLSDQYSRTVEPECKVEQIDDYPKHYKKKS